MTLRVGIEISTTAVRMAVVEDADHPELVSVASAPLANGAVRDGSLFDVAAATVAVRSCLDQAVIPHRRFTPPHAWVSVSGLRAITREIDLPPVPDAELDAAVRLQALDVLPFPLEDAIVASRRVQRSDGAPTGKVLLVAAHRELVEPVVQAVEDAGIRIDGVDLGAAALVRSLADKSTGGTEAIVSIGAELTTVVVQREGELCFVRTVGTGANAVTQSIGRKLDVPIVEAEELKLALPRTFDDLDSIRPEMLMALRDGATGVLSEIRTSLDYYAATTGGGELDRVIVTGGGALLPGLLDRIRLQLRAPVTLGDGFAHVGTSAFADGEADFGVQFAIAIGTALAGSSDARATDLMPLERRERRRVERVERSLLIGAAAVVGLCVIGGGLRLFEVFSAEHAAASLASVNAALSAEIPSYASVAREHAEVMSDAALVGPIVGGEVNWPAVLTALKDATPTSISSSGFTGSSASASTEVDAASTPLSHASSYVGTVNLSLSGTGYPAFQQWFGAMTGSGAFQIIQYSGLSSASSSVQFTAELGITKSIHTSRSGEFEEPK